MHVSQHADCNCKLIKPLTVWLSRVQRYSCSLSGAVAEAPSEAEAHIAEPVQICTRSRIHGSSDRKKRVRAAAGCSRFNLHILSHMCMTTYAIVLKKSCGAPRQALLYTKAANESVLECLIVNQRHLQNRLSPTSISKQPAQLLLTLLRR